MKQGIGLFGGTFNPIHLGHLIIARSVAEQLSLARMILIPSALPPHKQGKGLAAPEHRLKMVELAIAGDPAFQVSDVEVQRDGPSYTILTVQTYLQTLGSDTPLYWLIGADTMSELHTWYRINELADLCQIVTAARPGHESPDLSGLAGALSGSQIDRLRDGILKTPRIDISATNIRTRISEGKSIRYLVPEAVRMYIEERGLYRAE